MVNTKLRYADNLVNLKQAIDNLYEVDFYQDELDGEYETILRSLEKFTDKVILVVKEQEKQKLLAWAK